jgi:hypothetical protein
MMSRDSAKRLRIAERIEEVSSIFLFSTSVETIDLDENASIPGCPMMKPLRVVRKFSYPP